MNSVSSQVSIQGFFCEKHFVLQNLFVGYIGDENAIYRLHFSSVSTIFFHLTLAHYIMSILQMSAVVWEH